MGDWSALRRRLGSAEHHHRSQSFPALNARPQALLDEWLHRITEELAVHNRDHPDRPAAPFAVNQIVHKSNDRLEADLQTCAKWQDSYRTNV